MILIFSKSWNENSTEFVIEWLISNEVEFKRLNGDLFKNSSDCLNGEFVEFEELFSKASICWFRRWGDPKISEDLLKKAELSNYNYRLLNNFLEREGITYSSFLWYLLKDKEWLSYPVTQASVQKLRVLKYAEELGLMTPNTLVTSSKLSLENFHRKNGRIISKPISEPVMFISNNVGTHIKTVEVTDDDINKMPDKFSPSLFQDLIEKDIELRIFYLNGEFFPMAIFSQLDDKTEVDFRNYNTKKPNRTVPYNISKELKVKLVKLMQRLNLTTGSFDIVKNINGDYIFLEVNPVGQFGMVSYPCNYFLERRVAKFLTKRHDEKKGV